MEMASLAFLTPWFMEEMSARINSRIASPAASSAAVPTRKPDDSLRVETLNAP
jgi:hypothetical protein